MQKKKKRKHISLIKVNTTSFEIISIGFYIMQIFFFFSSLCDGRLFIANGFVLYVFMVFASIFIINRSQWLYGGAVTFSYLCCQKFASHISSSGSSVCAIRFLS